jgi:hypothetical protein
METIDYKRYLNDKEGFLDLLLSTMQRLDAINILLKHHGMVTKSSLPRSFFKRSNREVLSYVCFDLANQIMQGEARVMLEYLVALDDVSKSLGVKNAENKESRNMGR